MKTALIILAVWFVASLYFGLQICSDTFTKATSVKLEHPLKVACHQDK